MDIDTLFKIFKKQGYVSFDLGSFFPELTEYSDRFYEICDENWSWIIKNKQGENDFYPKQHPLSLIEKEKRAALSDYTNGLFSFSFRRIVDDHIGNSVIDFFKIKEIVNSKIFIGFLEKITGMEVKESTVIYLNRFDYGDFLTTHSDPGQKFGIVINFTKKWHMEYGGLTMILDHDCKYIIDTLTPYNMSVLVFDTCTKQIPHFVSMVTVKTPYKRIALVVRYD